MSVLRSAILAFLLVAGTVSAQEYQDRYARLWNLFGLNEANLVNTGLTVFPTLGIAPGGEYEGMAKAYTSLAREATFLDANPAGSVFVPVTELTILHSDLQEDVTMETLIYTVRPDRLGDLGLAAGGKFLRLPFQPVTVLETLPADRYAEFVTAANVSYRLFRRYPFDGVGIGLTAKIAYRSIPQVLYSHLPSVAGTNQNALGVLADVGVMTRFNLLKFHVARDKNFFLGAALRNAGPLIRDEPPPTVAAVGLGWRPFRPTLVSADLLVPVSLFPERFPAAPVGFALGMALTLTEFLQLHTGFRYENATPAFAMGTIVGLQDFSLVANYNLDVTTQSGALDRFSVQVRFDLGDRGRDEIQDRIDELYLEALVQVAEGNLEAAAGNLQLATELDPRFGPADALLRQVERTIALERQLQETQEQGIPGLDGASEQDVP